jgi:hypothetical protein
MQPFTNARTAAADATRTAGAVAEGAARRASPWLTRGARLGYAAKGIVYVTLGLVALQAAMGSGQTQDQRGALRTLAEQPAGKLLLGIVAVGLLAYAVWRVIGAVADSEGKGNEPKGLAARGGQAFRGVLYSGLGIEAWRLLRGTAGSASGNRTAHWTARAMELPAGRALVVAVGLGVIGYGLYQLWRAWKADVRKHLDLSEVSPETQEWIVRLGRLGYAARGVVFTIIGSFLVRAAMAYDPGQASGLGGALESLQGGTWGPWLLGVVALGLVAYGLFQIVQARYRVVHAA